MTESSFPFDDADTLEEQFSQLMSAAVDTGVVSGLTPYGDGSAAVVKVQAGEAVVRGFYYVNDSPLLLPVAAAGNAARTDVVVLRLDISQNRVRAAVKTGTTALTQTAGYWEMRLGTVDVPANGATVTAGQVTDARTVASLPFGRWSTVDRPSPVLDGKTGWNSDLRRVETWDSRSSTWVAAASGTGTAGGTTTAAGLPYGVVQSYRGDRNVDAPIIDAAVNNNRDYVNGDWDAVRQPGVYRIDPGAANLHAPGGAYLFGTLLVLTAGVTNASRTQVYYAQNGEMWWRTAWLTTDFGAWRGANAGGSSGTVDGTIEWGANVSQYGSNRTDVIRTGRSVTLRWNIFVNGAKPAGGDASSNLVRVPEGFRPVGGPADSVGHNGRDLWGVAVDTDGWLRLRTNAINGGGFWGTITYPTS